MEHYNVTGMSCAACSTRVEKAVSKLEGVNACSVNLLTNSMAVEGTASSKDIIEAVENAGYNASLQSDTSTTKKDDSFTDTETPRLKKRLLSSLIFLVVLMYFSMGHSMLNLPLPAVFVNNYIALGITQMLLAIIVMVINQQFFISGVKAVINKAPNMDTLVAMGSGASFIYSVYILFAMTVAVTKGNLSDVANYAHEFYFESAAMILALITVGKMLEARSKGKTTSALKGLIAMKPKTATIIRNNEEIIIPADEIKKDDIFVVKQGESFATDAIIIEGNCAANESALTGESIPVDKKKGDHVYAATINSYGYVKCQATKTSEDTILSQIIKMVSDASATKAPIAKAADKVSGVFVPIVICIAIITATIWMICGQSLGFALARAISVLVISCPCALGLATPVAIMVGSGVGAKNGILFKTASSLEATGKTQIIALDKTGTITCGEPKVTDITPCDHITEEELLSIAYSLEIKSEHPLAKAIVNKAKEKNLLLLDSTDYNAIPGNGLQATINNSTIIGGNLKFIENKIKVSDNIKEIAENYAKKGKTVLFFAKDNELQGIIAVADTVKEDSREAISELKNMGLYVVMLTGDNIQTANAIKELTGVDEVIAGVLPAGKEKVIRDLKKKGKTAMVGDGINDAPALTSADIGIAIGAGTDIAIDAADVVLMKSSLSDVPCAIRLSRAVLKNIHENLFWAFIYNTIGIPLAAGIWIPIFNLQLNPMFGAAAMSLSSFCVVTNALRLNLINIKSSAKDKRIKNNNFNKKENKTMEKTLKVEGMMCMHCEGRVKKCLEDLEGVKEAIVSHETGTATIISDNEVSTELIIKTIEEQGYKVIQ
ncbi:MAG: cadmium-translocating P-type ATPase [Lachnospiraceae bacterium]|nr:cadmium-translocating P-type ATPase [Lachnospiraceae bacterium]